MNRSRMLELAEEQLPRPGSKFLLKLKREGGHREVKFLVVLRSGGELVLKDVPYEGPLPTKTPPSKTSYTLDWPAKTLQSKDGTRWKVLEVEKH